ncbi:MAG: ABC transporter ATP-binding protein [Pseudomonadota bacterium]
MGEPVLELKGVTKVFETEEIRTHALREIDLTVERGDYVAISGPSGCGKSTLLSIMGLLDSASEGQYFVDGLLASDLTLDAAAELRNRKIGFIFQSFNLIDELSILDNVALPLRYRAEALPETEIVERAKTCLARLQLDHRMNHMPSQLSGGQQQRAAVARAMVTRPAVILADEPTGNLDVSSGTQVMEALAELNDAGATICVVTHNPDFAELAKTKVRLLDGQILS